MLFRKNDDIENQLRQELDYAHQENVTLLRILNKNRQRPEIEKRNDADLTNIYLFAYGSLLDKRNAKKVFLRDILPVPAFITGYSLKFSSPQLVRRIGNNDTVHLCNSLNLNTQAKPSDSVLGIITALSIGDIGRLVARENGYSLIDVTQNVRLADNCTDIKLDRVLSFIDLRNLPSEGLPVMEEYYWRCARGINCFSDSSLQLTRKMQLPKPDNLIPGDFEFVDELHFTYS